MRTTLFLLLACGLLAGAATALAPAAPLDWILPVLALLLGGCGLILLYRAVFAPAKALERDLRGLKETAALPCDAAYGLLRPVADAAAGHAELLRRELAQAQWDAEEATQSLEEWREKYKLIQAGQQLIRENLAASATRIHILSDELSRLLPSLAESGPGAAPAGEEALSRRARGADALITQFLKKFNSDLDFLNACLAQVEKIHRHGADRTAGRVPAQRRRHCDLVRQSVHGRTGRGRAAQTFAFLHQQAAPGHPGRQG